jgi:hypothetical protein
MAAISVGEAIGAGFGLIRRKPLAVLAWGFAQALGFGLFMVAYAVVVVSMFGVSAQAGSEAQPTPAEVSRILGPLLLGEGLTFLSILVFAGVRVVVTTAIWRAVLHPERSGWAYLRVGMAELFICLLLIGLQFAANLLMLPLMPLLILIAVLVAFQQFVLAIVVGVLAILALIAAVIYFELRFSILGPMIVDDGKFHFVEAWRLTRGHVGSLLLTGLGLVAVAIGAEVVLGLLALVTGAAVLYLAAGGLAPLEGFFEHPTPAFVVKLWPLAALWAALAVPIGGALSAIMVAPWAQAYRDLAPAGGVPGDTAQTFA